MHLAIPFTLLIGSFVAAAPSVQHAQITVEVTNRDAQNQVDALHSSKELVMNNDGRQNCLRFNFTLRATPAKLPFGFENLNVDGFVRGELGFPTVFALCDRKLITGNRALGYHPNFITPPWSSLWPLKIQEPNVLFDLVAMSKSMGGKKHHSLEFAGADNFFGAFEVKRKQPIFIGNSQDQYSRFRLLLAIKPIWKSSDDINDESVEELL